MKGVSEMGQAVAVIQGEIGGRQRLKKGGLLLTLRTESGMFAVRVDEKLGQNCDLTIGQQVMVTGRLRSFVFRGCGSRHLYLEAQAIATGRAGADLEQMLARWLAELVGPPAQGEVIIGPQ